jgi:hypothetical protein
VTCGVGHGKIHLQQQPTAESEVAISFSGWTASSCPHGGSHHLKVTYAFLPSDPVSCSVAKASADHQWSARDRDDPPRCYRTTLAGNKLLLSLSLQARTIQPAAVTPCEESFHTVQPSAFRTSDFRPSRSQARHLHCRRTTSPQHVRKQQIALLFSRESLLRGTSPAGSPHDQNERARIHSALQDLRNTPRTTTAPTSPRRHPHHFPLLLPFHTDFCFSGQSWPTMVGFLSQISSLSAPGPTGPTGPLTAVTSPSGQAISPRFGWAHRTIPAVRVSPLPCFRPRIDGHRLLRSPLMSSRPRAETLLLAQLQSTISRP